MFAFTIHGPRTKMSQSRILFKNHSSETFELHFRSAISEMLNVERDRKLWRKVNRDGIFVAPGILRRRMHRAKVHVQRVHFYANTRTQP